MPQPSSHDVRPRAAELPLALAVDVGSSSVRAMLHDRLGRPLSGLSATVGYEMSASPDCGVQIGLAAVAAVLAVLFGGVGLAAWFGGEGFLAVMGAVGCLMTAWVGGLTLFRG